MDDYRTKIEINRIREEKAALEEYRKSQEKLRQEELESRLKVSLRATSWPWDKFSTDTGFGYL